MTSQNILALLDYSAILVITSSNQTTGTEKISCESQVVQCHFLNDWLQLKKHVFHPNCCRLQLEFKWLTIYFKLLLGPVIPVVLIFKPCEKYLSMYIKV